MGLENKRQERWKKEIQDDISKNCLYHGSINQRFGRFLNEKLKIDTKLNELTKEKKLLQLKIEDIESGKYTDKELWDRWGDQPHTDKVNNAKLLDLIDEQVFISFLLSKYEDDISKKTNKGIKIISAIELIEQCIN